MWLARGDFPLNLTISAIAVVAVCFLLLPRLYDLAFCLALGLSGWGDALGLYERVGFYDIVVHTLASFFLAPVFYIVLAHADVLPDLKDVKTTHHFVGVFTFDHFLGTNLAKSERDTATDLMVDGLGAVAGAALLVAWANYVWGSVRRVPGENRREQIAA